MHYWQCWCGDVSKLIVCPVCWSAQSGGVSCICVVFPVDQRFLCSIFSRSLVTGCLPEFSLADSRTLSMPSFSLWNQWDCSSLKLTFYFYFFQYLINFLLRRTFSSSVCLLHRPETFGRKHSLVAHRRQNNLLIQSTDTRWPGRVTGSSVWVGSGHGSRFRPSSISGTTVCTL